MKVPVLFYTLFFFFRIIPSFSQTPAVVISSYYNSASPLQEWTELLVVKDNTNMHNWKLQDCNSGQTAWQPAITFSRPAAWDHMRAGTIIMIYHREAGGYRETLDQASGYLELAADDRADFVYFSGGSFGTWPLYNGPTLNIDSPSDLLVLLDSTGNVVHALGHGAVPGPLYNALPLPKLNYKNSIDTGVAVCVCPGANLNEYGTLAPQDGITWVSGVTGGNLTLGLPNKCTASVTANSNYVRSLRQPDWINPTLSGMCNASNTLVTLNWNPCVDPYPDDGIEHYIILRNTFNVFGAPVDGVNYNPGDNIGGATVVARDFGLSTNVNYVDTVQVSCNTGIYYEIFALRYGPDLIPGVIYDAARASAYNESSFASAHVLGVLPVAPLSATSDHDTVCSNDNGNITLSAQGGSGATLNWYTTSCMGTLVGTSTGPANSLTIPSPVTVTTYYAAWVNNCGVTACANVTVTVIPAVPASVTIAADQSSICPGTLVTFTASPVNEGNSPVYTWTVNGNSGQSGSSLVYRTDSLRAGDEVICWLNSSITCPATNPVGSAPLAISVFPSPVVNLTDKPFLCAGDSAHLDAGPGFASYLWQDGSAGRYYTAINTGTYRVTVADSHGCSGSDSVQLKNCDSTLFVPDAFSPNNDGVNDVFKVVSSGDNLPGFSMQIFDRWGALVFESTDINKGWNGQIQNRLAPSDTYVWIITYQQFSLTSANGSTKRKHGTVVLIR